MPPDPLMVTYPFPLRPDCLARIVLPDDLTRSEARRLADMIQAAAQPDDEVDPDAT